MSGAHGLSGIVIVADIAVNGVAEASRERQIAVDILIVLKTSL